MKLQGVVSHYPFSEKYVGKTDKITPVLSVVSVGPNRKNAKKPNKGIIVQRI